ncbi:MAG TPA: DUF2232 domain-containing protein [Longimicrobiales bacterium]|nr:DUF2232 domain-containing protein [Longimicrobiales bacterium]
MSDATRTEAGPGRRGWGSAIALGVATLLLWSLHPTLLILVPFALLLIALPPRRPPLVVGAALLLWFLFSGSRSGALWYVERGWALLLAGWFIAFGAMWPRRSFIVRGLASVAATMASAALVVASSRPGPSFVEGLVSQQMRTAASESIALFTQMLGFERVSAQVQEAMFAAADLQVLVFPALLALGSLTGLAVAWFVYRRLGIGDAAPLRPLREFRFPDDLVWVLIAGMLLLVLPLGAAAERAGTNLLTFMAALYALRGLAVLLVVAGVPGPLGLVVSGVLLLFLYPLIMAMTVLVGVTDTWLDIRARRVAAPPSS